MLKKILSYFDYSVQKELFIVVAGLVAAIIYAWTFNIVEVLENSIIENVAIIPLVIAAIMCFRAKNNKVLFNVIGFVILLMIAREFSYGRVPFCEIPDRPNEYYSWSHYKYGWIAHVIVGIYIALVTLYAVIKRVWKDIIDVINKAKIILIPFLCVVVCVLFQMYAEKISHSSLVEELAEFALYCTILVIVMCYLKKLKD